MVVSYLRLGVDFSFLLKYMVVVLVPTTALGVRRTVVHDCPGLYDSRIEDRRLAVSVAIMPPTPPPYQPRPLPSQGRGGRFWYRLMQYLSPHSSPPTSPTPRGRKTDTSALLKRPYGLCYLERKFTKSRKYTDMVQLASRQGFASTDRCLQRIT